MMQKSNCSPEKHTPTQFMAHESYNASSLHNLQAAVRYGFPLSQTCDFLLTSSPGECSSRYSGGTQSIMGVEASVEVKQGRKSDGRWVTGDDSAEVGTMKDSSIWQERNVSFPLSGMRAFGDLWAGEGPLTWVLTESLCQLA